MVPLLIAAGVFVFAAGVVLALYYGATKVPGLMVQRKVEARIADVARRVEPEPGLGFELGRLQRAGGAEVAGLPVDLGGRTVAGQHDAGDVHDQRRAFGLLEAQVERWGGVAATQHRAGHFMVGRIDQVET